MQDFDQAAVRIGQILKRRRAGKSLTKADTEFVARIEDASAGRVGRPRNPEPVFESLAACAGATGIPEMILKSAKRKGCPAFEAGNRIRLYALTHWLFDAARTEDGVDWGARLKEYLAKLALVRLKREEREVMPVAEAVEIATRISALLNSALDRLWSELPPILKGLDEPAIRARGQSATDQLKTHLAAEFRRLS
jgi:hypothetical protein